MENILKNVIEYNSNLWVGVGAALLVAMIVAGISVVVSSRRKPALISYLICLVSVPFLSYQFSRIYGAVETEKIVDILASPVSYASGITENLFGSEGLLDNELMDGVAALFPGVGDMREFLREIPSGGEQCIRESREYIKWYIVRRGLWSALFLVITVVGVAVTMEDASPYDGRHGRGISRTHDRVTRRHSSRSSYRRR